MKGASRLPASESGAYRMGYAIIAAAMALALMATVPLVAGSLPRMMQLLTGLLETGF